MNSPTLDRLDDLNTRLHAIRSACFNCQLVGNGLELLTVGANCAAAEQHLNNAITRVEKEINQHYAADATRTLSKGT